MTDFYSRASFTINCERNEAQEISDSLTALQNMFRLEGPNPANTIAIAQIASGEVSPKPSDSLGVRVWMRVVAELIARTAMMTADGSIDPEQVEGPGFDCVTSTSPGSWKANDGLCLFGDVFQNDMFSIATIILQELHSEEVILTGIADVASKPGDNHFGGSTVVISADGFEYLNVVGDEEALKTQFEDRAAYWLITYEADDRKAPHLHAVTLETHNSVTSDEVKAILLAEYPQAIDVDVTALRAITYNDIKNAIPTMVRGQAA